MQIDAVFHALPEYDIKNKKKNEQSAQILEL
jgi:hypothetical protein